MGIIKYQDWRRIMKFLDEIKKFFYNKRHIEAIVLSVILLVIVSVVLSEGPGSISHYGGSASSGDASISGGSGKTEKTAYKKEKKGSQLHDLLESYYKDYAAGDTDDLAKIADPISDMEKSYIRFMSSIVDSYDIEQIYTKKGVSETSWLVSAYVNMHFKGLKSAAPGLDFFYVEQGSDGALRINNLYSSFNQTNRENVMDPKVVSAIASFEEQKDVVDLQTKVQKEYNEISLSDKDFDEFMTKTYPKKVKSWQAKYRVVAKKAEEAKKKAEEAKKKEEEKAAKKEEEKKEEEKKEEEKKEESTESKDSGKPLYKTKTKTNLRKHSSVNSDIIKTLAKGTKVTKIKDKGKWMKVKYNDKTGYIRKMYLKKVKSSSSSSEKSDKAQKPKEGKKLILKDTLNIRKKPDTDAKRINLAYAGEKVLVIKNRDDGWTKVSYHHKKGYVKTEYLK